MNYFPTCTSSLGLQYLYQVSFKSMQGCRRSWEDKLWCDGRTEWRNDRMTEGRNDGRRTKQTLNAPLPFYGGGINIGTSIKVGCTTRSLYASKRLPKTFGKKYFVVVVVDGFLFNPKVSFCNKLQVQLLYYETHCLITDDTGILNICRIWYLIHGLLSRRVRLDSKSISPHALS